MLATCIENIAITDRFTKELLLFDDSFKSHLTANVIVITVELRHNR